MKLVWNLKRPGGPFLAGAATTRTTMRKGGHQSPSTQLAEGSIHTIPVFLLMDPPNHQHSLNVGKIFKTPRQAKQTLPKGSITHPKSLIRLFHYAVHSSDEAFEKKEQDKGCQGCSNLQPAHTDQPRSAHTSLACPTVPIGTGTWSGRCTRRCWKRVPGIHPATTAPFGNRPLQ